MSEKIPTIYQKNQRSVCPWCGSAGKSGSVTVEAAMVLPLFFMAMMLAAAILNLWYVHRQVGTAVENTCRTMSAYAYPVEHAQGTVLPNGGGNVLSLAYAEGAVMKELSAHPLAGRLITGFVDLTASDILGDGQTVDLIARYTIHMSVGPFHSGNLRFSQRVRMHGWLGYRENGLSESAENEETVYVTESGSVYHRSADCSYLNPSVRPVTAEQLISLRSSDGSVYYACELCKAAGGVCYITNYGNRYHVSPSCSGIKRSIRTVSLSQVEGILGPCSKCGR